ncbi:MAG TPA: TlpA disulfide reductase family protein [Terriglobia bacterium]|nr:TlpA disulfide reductase family protein [Terriglobia bacterium]
MMSAIVGRRAWVLATTAVVFALICARFVINFSTPYPPSTDAGYYPMQTLYWLAHGRMMYDDLPLLFWMNIALTWLLNVLGNSLDAAALLASRILDCILQPLTAVPIMIAGYVWSEGRRKGIAGSVSAALLVTASPAILRLLSEFQKNSLGLVWMAAAIWMCRSSMVSPTRQRWTALGALLALSGLTHIGSFGVTAMAVGISLLVWCWQEKQTDRVYAVGAAGVLLLALLFIFDSRRALAIVRSPVDMFVTGPLQSPVLLFIIVTVLVVGLAVRRAWIDRAQLPAADFALIAGLSATFVFLILPKNGEYFGRLALMTTIPAAFLILFILARRAAAGRSSMPAFIILLLVAVSYREGPPTLQPPMMDELAAREFREFKQQMAAQSLDLQRILVVAPHGLDWWAGYFLGTPVRMVQPETLDPRYERLLLVRNIARVGGIPGPSRPLPLGPPARRLYKGQVLEVYEVVQDAAVALELWIGSVELAPGKTVMFKAELDLQSVPPIGYLIVGDERSPIPEISVNGDLLRFDFSEYGADMLGTFNGKTWQGEYRRHRENATKSFRFLAERTTSLNPGTSFAAAAEALEATGNFKVRFEDEKNADSATSAKFWKAGEAILGTFIAPDGDYGLLEGVAGNDGDMIFHRFTGWQATRIDLRKTSDRWAGSFLAASIDKPRAFMLEPSMPAAVAERTKMKNPSAAFEFACEASTGGTVRHTDFKGKAMIVDIMGTWCHNCLDSAPVLQQLQSRHEQQGLQVVGLSFEIRDDARLAQKNLSLFKQRFGLTYPLLYCGDLDDANVDRRLKSQLDGFFAYPTTLFIDREGKVQSIHTGFKGPGTGDDFASEVALFNRRAERLVTEAP